MTPECGPPTLTTTGAETASPPSSVDAGDVPAPPADRDDGLPEPELGAVVAGGVGQVVGGQHRVVDVAAVGVVERRQLAVGVVAEGRVVDPLRRVVARRRRGPGSGSRSSSESNHSYGMPISSHNAMHRHAVVAGGAEDQVAGRGRTGPCRRGRRRRGGPDQSRHMAADSHAVSTASGVE